MQEVIYLPGNQKPKKSLFLEQRVINIGPGFKCSCGPEVYNLLFVLPSVPSAMVVCTNEHPQQPYFSKIE